MCSQEIFTKEKTKSDSHIDFRYKLISFLTKKQGTQKNFTQAN